MKHPALDKHQNGDRHLALWHTNSDLPVQHLLSPIPPNIPVLSTAEQEPIPVDTPEAVSPVTPVNANPTLSSERPLSDFSRWLLQMEPPEVAGVSPVAPGKVAAGTELAQQIVEPEEPMKDAKKEKKKKDRKKRKKHKKGKSKKQKKLAAKLGAIDESLVTDTLAELAAKRGYKEEAIAMYRLLVSMHPEKAAHYLEQIQMLRSEEEE